MAGGEGTRAAGAALAERAAPARDHAEELDDRVKVRQLMEGLRGRLSAREREAASLCYLQGLSRAQAAARMGLSEARMRKLMEGRSRARPGVAAKVGAIVETISSGRWCEEQGSLMRAFAFGILDPDGDRYRLADAHRRQCPACRRYVRSLRGLAVVLPPVLSPLTLAAGAVGGSGAGASSGGALAAAKGAGAGASGGGLSVAGGAGSAGGASLAGGGSLAGGASAAGGAAGAGGGWLVLGGGLGAKLAAGCLVALGIGVGCVALGVGGIHGRRHGRAPLHAPAPPLAGSRPGTQPLAPPAPRGGSAPASQRRSAARAPAPVAGARREFSPEQQSSRQGGRAARPAAVPAGTVRAPAGNGGSAAHRGGGAGAAAEREFSPG